MPDPGMNGPGWMRVLLVEGSPSDAQALSVALHAGDAGQLELVHVSTVAAALEALDREEFDAVLLDLALPEAAGAGGLLEIHQRVPATPVLVLTAGEELEAGMAAVQAGAQDYLVKDHLDVRLLQRSVRHAVERMRLQRERDETRHREQDERELHSMERLSAPLPAAHTAEIFSASPLRKASPDTFQQAVADYRRLLDRALERRLFRVDNGFSEELRGLGERLGFLRAGPRDVIEIHTSALRLAIDGETRARARAYLEESRLAVLELMGHLTSFYRRHYPAASQRPSP